MEARFWFLSFANSGLGRWIRNPLKRIRRQAETMGVFGDRIRIWTEHDLDADFHEQMKGHLVAGSRGYGYWCWKPQIVLQLLREMEDGDVLLYADAGCHLNPRGTTRLMEYFALAKEHGIVAFEARSMDDTRRDDPSQHFLTDGEWCKGDLLDYYGVRAEKDITETGQLGGTAFLVEKNDDTQKFFAEFLDVFKRRFELCDDSPSISSNLPGFKENRHDQSVFSILGKKHGACRLSCGEYALINGFAPEAERSDHVRWPLFWNDLSVFPIWAKHDKGGVRSLFPVWIKKIVHAASGGRI